jgi:hypothetical protein
MKYQGDLLFHVKHLKEYDNNEILHLFCFLVNEFVLRPCLCLSREYVSAWEPFSLLSAAWAG